MTPYTTITIIYNPNSTGPGKQLAEQLAARLKAQAEGLPVIVQPTDHKGHAEELAYRLATDSRRALVISASGDGGYHEVVNGLVKAMSEGATPTAGLLPAGNANDHYRSLHVDDDLAERIIAGTSRTIDLLRLEYRTEGKRRSRYAHSYIGLGLTPQAGMELNRHSLNRFVEFFIVCGVLVRLRAARIVVDGKVRAYDSLVCSNIAYMSKFLSVSDAADPADGRFELTAWKRRSRIRLCWSLIMASTRGIRGRHHVRSFSFQTVQPETIQLDGEIVRLDAGSNAAITLEPSMLECII